MNEQNERRHEVALNAEEPSIGSKWGDTITHERKAELDDMATAWGTESNRPKDPGGPYSGVELTGADVFYLAIKAMARPNGDIGAAEANLRSYIEQQYRAHSLTVRYPPHSLILDGARLDGAHLEFATLNGASLKGASLMKAHLGSARLLEARLDGAYLTDARMEYAVLDRASLIGAGAMSVDLRNAYLRETHLEQAMLIGAHLEGAHLEGAYLEKAQLDDATLVGVHLEEAHLDGTNLRRATFDKTSRLNGVTLDGALMDQTIFDNTNLSVVDWEAVRHLGDELEAKKPRVIWPVNSFTTAVEYRDKHRIAARAYRALSVLLRAQGIGRPATHFHTQSERMEVQALRYEAIARWYCGGRVKIAAPWWFLRWLVSLAVYGLILLAGNIGALFVVWASVVVIWTLAYIVAGLLAHTGLSWVDALALSITSLHGRGLQPASGLTDVMRALAAVEAVSGLVVEALFIAALTCRVLGNPMCRFW